MGGRSDLERIEGFGREQLFRLQPPPRQALLVVIAQEGVEHMPVRCKSVRPPILSHRLQHFLDLRDLPRQHGRQRRGRVQVLIYDALRADKRLEQRLGDPWIRVVDVAADRDGVHDRENAGLAIIRAFDGNVIFEQPLDGTGPAPKCRWYACGVHRIDFSVGDHPRERLRRSDTRDLELRRQIELELLLATGLLLASDAVFDAGRIDAVLVLQNPANPYWRGHLVFGRGDALADQLLRLLDSTPGGNEDARMAEEPRGKHWDRDECGIFARDRHGIRGKRHLGDVEFAVPQHAEERLLDMLVQIDKLDAFGLDAAVGERARAVVIPAGQGQPQLAQIDSPKRRGIIPGSRPTRSRPSGHLSGRPVALARCFSLCAATARASSRARFSRTESRVRRVAVLSAARTPRTATRLTSSASGTSARLSALPLAVRKMWTFRRLPASCRRAI